MASTSVPTKSPRPLGKPATNKQGTVMPKFIDNIKSIECNATLPIPDKLRQKWSNEPDQFQSLHHPNSPILTPNDATIIHDWEREQKQTARCQVIKIAQAYINGQRIAVEDATLSTTEFQTLTRAYRPSLLIDPEPLELHFGPAISGNAHQRRKTRRARFRQLAKLMEQLERLPSRTTHNEHPKAENDCT